MNTPKSVTNIFYAISIQIFFWRNLLEEEIWLLSYIDIHIELFAVHF